jgi:hypothetical protein
MHSVQVAQVPLPNFAAAAPASYATSGPPGFFGGSSGMGPAPTFTSGPSYGSRGSGRGGGRGGGGPPPARMLLSDGREMCFCPAWDGHSCAFERMVGQLGACKLREYHRLGEPCPDHLRRTPGQRSGPPGGGVRGGAPAASVAGSQRL